MTPTSSTTTNDQPNLSTDLQALLEALAGVAERDPQLATQLTRIFATMAGEASRGPRFANALAKALREPSPGAATPKGAGRRPSNRRNQGPFDPFAVYAEGGDEALRRRLNDLALEQLRDIIAEHGMDNDRLAMKWKDRDRVIDRIVERVIDRTEKGSAFR